MIVDSSFLIALFIEEDELNERAIEFLERNKEESLLLLDRVLEETFTVITYKKGIDSALSAVEDLQKNKNIIIHKIEENEFNSIMELAIKLKRKISFVDYSLIYFYLRTRDKVISFDSELNKIIKSFWKIFGKFYKTLFKPKNNNKLWW